MGLIPVKSRMGADCAGGKLHAGFHLDNGVYWTACNVGYGVPADKGKDSDKEWCRRCLKRLQGAVPEWT